MSIRITEDEVDKRAREIRDMRKLGATIDASSIKGGQKDKRYKWVNRRARDGERVNHFTDVGYTTVKAAKEGEAGNVINGDLVLMETPRDNYLDRLAKNKIRADDAEKAFMGQRKDELNRIARNEGHAKSDVAFDDSTQGAERIIRRRATESDDD